jgi:RhtB (resistance to homoserine/threonine) family protein
MVVKNTLGYSRRAGFFTAGGITAGILFHLTYCLLGFAVIISRSPFLFNIIKYAGAAYLIYIGFKGLLSKDNPIAATVVEKNMLSDHHAFHQGLFCNMLNPKASLFFLGLFTLVVSPDTPLTIQLGYGFEIIFITFLWFFSLTFMLTQPKIEHKLQSLQHIMTKLMGILLILFGTQLALFHHA